MSARSNIRFLRRKEIDIIRWNDCIERADNGLIYAYSYYLDAMCTNWDALIFNDYEAVMPLPWRKKWGIKYAYHPPFIAQLGLFGQAINNTLLTDFIRSIPRSFRYIDFPLNQKNLFPPLKLPFYERNNYVLPLNESYENLYKKYRDNIKRNIIKANRYGCEFQADIPIQSVIKISKQYMARFGTEEEGFERFQRLFIQLQQSGKARTFGVRDANNNILASCVFVFSHGRAYYILVGNHPNGRTLGASHMLIDGFIKHHAGQELLLDFEGSDVRNLAFFYSSFGAVVEKYAALRLNRLPWWIKWMKK